MTIWILVLLLLACTAGMGLRQGAIRAALTFVGIIVGALLAPPIGGLLKPLLGLVGVKNPVIAWLLGPALVFVLILAVFKIIGLTLHSKADVYYKYKAGDLRLALWGRLNLRLGLALGLANGAAYLVLLSFIIYIFSYWTVQLTPSDSNPMSLRLLNRLGKDLQSSGMIKVARAIDGMPAAYYEAADVAGLLYQTPLLEARLSRYPALLTIGERRELQEAATDVPFSEMRLRKAPVTVLLDQPQSQTIVNNPDLLKDLWAAVEPNITDLRTYLETGRSPKYESEKILGRWTFDMNGSVSAFRKARPTVPLIELRRWLAAAFANASFIAAPDQTAILKNVPPLMGGASPEPQTLRGQWKKADGLYQVTLTMDGQNQQWTGAIEGSRLTITTEGAGLAFLQE